MSSGRGSVSVSLFEGAEVGAEVGERGVSAGC